MLKIFTSPEPNYRGKMKKNFFCWFSIFYMFHAILKQKNEKKNFDPKFWNFNPPPNRPNSKFWNSDFTRWWHLPRRFIFEKISVPLGKATEWRAENLQKWPKITKFWLWTPIKNFRGKNSKFHFHRFLLNIVLNKYATFGGARIETLKALAILSNLDGRRRRRRRTDGRTDRRGSVPDRISSADYVTAELKMQLHSYLNNSKHEKLFILVFGTPS